MQDKEVRPKCSRSGTRGNGLKPIRCKFQLRIISMRQLPDQINHLVFSGEFYEAVIAATGQREWGKMVSTDIMGKSNGFCWPGWRGELKTLIQKNFRVAIEKRGFSC